MSCAMSGLLLPFLCLSLSTDRIFQDKAPQVGQVQSKQRLPTENDALALAAADLTTLPIADRYYTRYIWITSGSLNRLRAVSLTLNYVSRSATIVRPAPLGRDKLLVGRIDLRYYAPRETDLQEWLETWEEFQFDPRFNILFTKDTLRFNFGIKIPQRKQKVTRPGDWKEVDCPPWVHTDGRTYYKKWVQETITEYKMVDPFAGSVNVVRQVGLHLNLALIAFLIDNTGSQAPIVNDGYFVTRTLTTIQDDGLYKDLYRGLYYEFAGVKRGFKKGTDEDNFLEKLGIGNVKQGVTAAKVFDNLRSDARVVIAHSGVTGRTRRVDVFRSLAAHVASSTSIVSFTHDIKRKSIDIGQDPLFNLLNFRDDAREVIAENANGFHLFVLFNAQGALQDQVPDDIAADDTIPAPYGHVLQPAIGCIRCHAKDNGWRKLPNDIKRILGSTFDVYADISRRHTLPKGLFDDIDRIVGLYAGDLEMATLPRARDDLARAYLKATGPWEKLGDQTGIIQAGSGEISALFSEYNYRTLGPADVLRDLGIECDPAEAAKMLSALLPPLPEAAIAGIIPESPRIAALKMDVRINRSQYDLEYAFIAGRIRSATKK